MYIIRLRSWQGNEKFFAPITVEHQNGVAINNGPVAEKKGNKNIVEFQN